MPFDPNFGNSSDEDLLALGRQAGYLPEEQNSGETIAPPEPPAMNQGLTPPFYNHQSPPADSGPVTTGGMASVGTSYRGFSDPGYNRISKHDSELTASYKRADAEAAQGANRDASILQQAAPGAIDAEKAKAQALSDQALEQGRGALVMQRLQDSFAVEEAKMNAQATAQSNQAKADYLAALNDFRAAKVDPAQLWRNMGTGDRIGMITTAFVHDFLGAKGIHTSAMDTFNKAIDRNIDAQIQAIKTKGEVAEGFKSLWYMQRNQSASDAEARTRVRGFLLEGAKQQVVANMAQYESALASAQGKQAIAKIDEELAKNLIAVYQHADTNALQLRNQALEQWRTKVNASLEQQSINLKREELERQKKKDEKDAMKVLEPIYDPEDHTAHWVFNPNLNLKDDEKAAVRTRLAAINEVNRSLEKLKELVRTGNKTFDLVNGTRLANTTGQQYEALANRIAHGMAKANNERATDQDVAQFRQGLPPATHLNQGDIEKIIASTQQDILNQSKVLSTYAMDLPEGSRGYYGTSASDEGFGASNVVAKNTISPPPKGKEELIREEADKYLRPADKNDSIAKDEDSLTEGIVEAKQRFLGTNPQFETQGVSAGQQLQDQLDSKPTGDITRADKGLMMLARAAQGGDTIALNQLKQYAGAYINAGSHDEESMWAAFLLNEIQPGAGDNPVDKGE